jgi:hypothetical protein
MPLRITTLCHYAECRYAECHYAECRYAECRYAECRYAECRGAVNSYPQMSELAEKTVRSNAQSCDKGKKNF